MKHVNNPAAQVPSSNLLVICRPQYSHCHSLQPPNSDPGNALFLDRLCTPLFTKRTVKSFESQPRSGVRTSKPATQISILIKPGAARAEALPLFPVLLSLRLHSNINAKRQGDKGLIYPCGSGGLLYSLPWITVR